MAVETPAGGWRADLKAGSIAGMLVAPTVLEVACLHLLGLFYGGAAPGTLLLLGSLVATVGGLLVGLFAGGLAGLLFGPVSRRLPGSGASRGLLFGLAVGGVLTALSGSRAWGPWPLAPYLLGGGAAWGFLTGVLRNRWRKRAGWALPALVAVAAVLLAVAGLAVPRPGSEYSLDLLGPSPVATAAGDGGLAAGLTREGTLAVLAWPGPGGNDQMAYRTASAALPRMGAGPEMGAFAVLRLSTTGGPVTTRLDERGWNSTPGYRAPGSPVVRTRSVNPGLGVEVVQEDAVVPGHDVLLRNLRVSLLPGSPVTAATLDYHANFNPTTARVESLPVADWLLDRGLPEEVRCGDGGVVHTTRGMEVAVAWTVEPRAAFHCVSDGDGRAVAELPLDLSPSAEATVVISVASTPDQAVELWNGLLPLNFSAYRDLAEASARQWLASAPLPNTTDPRVVEVAMRSLLSLRTAADRATGSIVASISRQPPYYVDWSRDGVFIDHALDRAGHPEMVDAHHRFYARVQRSSGTWSMAYYTSGAEGAPIPFEIDETGLALWGLWDHYGFTRNRTYLQAVYPAMARGADFLAWWRDPFNGLQAHANEDDYLVFTQGLQGAVATYAGLEAAARAGEAAGEVPARVRMWRERAGELREAALRVLWNGHDFGGDHGAGAWFLWPARMLPPDDPRAGAQAEQVWASIESRMNRTVRWGMYEAKGGPALAYAWSGDAGKMERVREVVRWLARDVADPDTGHFGELHLLENGPGGPRWVNHIAMPHAWTHALFYISALDASGERTGSPPG